jgi:hypothetical protein
MAGEEYIKVATSNLQRAIVIKQNEANDIRRQIRDLDGERHRKKQEIESRINSNNAQAVSNNTNDIQRANLLRENAQLEAEKSRVDHDFDYKRTDLERKLREKEDEWRDIQDKMGELGTLV